MSQVIERFEEDIEQILIQHDDPHAIADLISHYHAYEVAKVLLQLNDDLKNKLYTSMPISRLTEVFEALSPEDAFDLFEGMSVPIIIDIFDHFETDDLVEIIANIDDQEKQLMYMSLIPLQKRKIIKSFLHFDDEMVGSIMNNNFVQIEENLTVKKAIRHLVEVAPNVEYINNIYVVNNRQQLVGTLTLKELMSQGHHKSTLIKDIMVENLVYLFPTTDIEDAIETMKNYDFQLLPVINSDHQMIGIISFDDTLDALNEESSADYASLAGLTDVEIKDDESVWSSLKKRLPWLFILLFVNLITSSIISSYEKELQTLTTLAIFMPLILNMAGNSSTQGLGVIIRLFATNQLKAKKMVIKHLLKEILIGFINGFVIAIGLFLLVLIFNVIRNVPLNEGLNFALVIGLSIQLALIVATLAGSLVPLFMHFIKIDPATASGPFITTINDILSLLIYFGLATTFIVTLT